jgi:23S rRNA (guanosine2251-2'-O)-methyltransferase
MTDPAGKPQWAIDRDRQRRAGPEPVWLFGIHAVRDALLNPLRERQRLIVTRNAADRLADAIATSGMTPEMADARRFPAPLDPQSVHQGAAMEVAPLDWGDVSRLCRPHPQDPAPIVLALDRITDPHNVGAILRSAEVFGARAVIAPRNHSAPESGGLAKAASGALERQPYIRIPNLAGALQQLEQQGYTLVGLDGTGAQTLATAAEATRRGPVCLVLGAEGPGLRERTRELCHHMVRIDSAAGFASLNVSNAAAVALYALSAARPARTEAPSVPPEGPETP